MKKTNVDCLELLFNFLDLRPPSDGLIGRILKIFEEHEASFGGRDLPMNARLQRAQNLLTGDPQSTKEDYWGFDLFGYSMKKWGTSTTCASWIKQLPELIKAVMKKNETTYEYYRAGREDWRQRHAKF